MATDSKNKVSQKTFTYEEFKKTFLPSSIDRPISKRRNPVELGVKMAKKALLELGNALQISLSKK